MQMDKLKTGIRRTLALPGHMALTASAILASATVAGATTSSNANVRGALATNQEAMTAVQGSSLTNEGAGESIQNVTNLVLLAAGLVGIVVAFVGLFMVYKHNKEGDRAQGSPMAGWIVVAIGGLITIVAIATAVVPNLLVGQGT